jgi:hypothetical protein
MAGFVAELSKTGGVGQVGKWLSQNVIKNYGGRMGASAALGAGVGAATAKPGERLKGALGGAAGGAALGGGTILATKAGRQALKKGTESFGRRQLYSITGKGIKGQDEAFKYGLLKKPGENLKGRALEKAKRQLALRQDAFGKGYLHAPGIAKGLVKNPGDVLKSSWKRQDLMGKGFVGLGGYQTAKGIAETPEPGGPGRLQKGLEGVGQTVGWLVAPQTLIGGSLVGVGGGYAGRQVGRLGEKLTRRGGA